MKYFSLSFDDGVEQDKVIIELLRKYSVPATFNLNSGLFGSPGFIRYAGTESVESLSSAKPTVWDGGGIADLSRISEDEICQVYQGFELATHCVMHEDLTTLSDDEMYEVLIKDRDMLQQYTTIPVVGHAFPYGRSNEHVNTFLKQNSFLYARGVTNTSGAGLERFKIPSDPFGFSPTCRITDPDISSLLDQFISIDDHGTDIMFYMWGHCYEIDFQPMKDRDFLNTFEKMLSKISSCSEICLCTNSELFQKLHI